MTAGKRRAKGFGGVKRRGQRGAGLVICDEPVTTNKDNISRTVRTIIERRGPGGQAAAICLSDGCWPVRSLPEEPPNELTQYLLM